MTNFHDHISPQDLRAYPAEVAKVVMDAVNNHGVLWRPLGNNVRLYNGDRSTEPYKVNGSLPGHKTLRMLMPWLEKNTSWTRPVKGKAKELEMEKLQEAAKKTAEMILDPAAPVEEKIFYDVVPTQDEESSPPREGMPGERWTLSYHGKDAKNYGFETNGKVYRCVECGHIMYSGQGQHLHQKTHTDPEYASRLGARGNEVRHHSPKQEPLPVETDPHDDQGNRLTPAEAPPESPEGDLPDDLKAQVDDAARRMSQEQRRELQQIVSALATHAGMKLADDGEVQRLLDALSNERERNRSLRDQVAHLVKEKEELTTKLALVKEHHDNLGGLFDV